MKSLAAILGAVGLLQFAAAAADVYTWKSAARVDDQSWGEAGNFEENGVPTAGDTVVIPAGVTVYVKPTDSVSRLIVSQLGHIRPMASEGQVGQIVFETNGAEDVFPLNAKIMAKPTSTLVEYESDLSYRDGLVIKRGEGELKLQNVTQRFAYYVNFKIEAGSVRMPYTPNSLGLGRMHYGHITIDEGAKLIIGTADTQGYNYTQPRGIWGKGTITNEGPRTQELRPSCYDPSDSICWFEGTITGDMRVVPYNALMLTGVNSTFKGTTGTISVKSLIPTGPDSKKGVLGLRKIGMKAEKISSAGASEGIGTDEDGGAIVYLGEGEVTDKDFTMRYSRAMSWIDAGAKGGIEFTGRFMINDSKSRSELVLSGSNTAPAIVSGQIAPSLASGSDWCFVKKGSGTWRFLSTTSVSLRSTSASYEINEGTFQFDSLRPANEYCAFGMGTNRVETYYGNRDDAAHRVDYNFALGGVDGKGNMTEGTLEPVIGPRGGITNTFFATDRPIALKGDGRIVMNALDNGKGDQYRITMRGVKAITEGEHTLTLDGTGINDNTIADIIDGAGTVSVVKKGTGTWVLAGTNSFSGKLTVREGRLIVNNTKDYSWYRLKVRSLNTEGSQMHISNIGMYDKDGVDQARGITVSSYGDHTILAPGKVADGRSSAQLWGINNLVHLFSNSTSDSRYKMYGLGTASTFRPTDVSNGSPVIENPDTWYYIEFRLPAGAKPVTSYDMMVPFDNIDPTIHQQAGNKDVRFGNCAKSWILEGSTDGIHWDELHDVLDASNMSGDMHYAEAGKTNYWMAAQIPINTRETGHLGGVEIASGLSEQFAMLNNAEVSVEAGAELVVEGEPLTIGKFKANAAGAGTMKNVKFANTGVFAMDALDMTDGYASISYNLEGVTGFDNIENWMVTKDGEVTHRYVLSVKDNTISVYKKGSSIIIR